MRAAIAALSVALLIPTLLVSYWLANLSAASEQAQIEQAVLQEAAEVSAFVDREIVGVQTVLVALASSPSLQSADLAGFYRQAADVAGRLNYQIVLRDVEAGRQVLNTVVPWGASLEEGIAAPLGESEEADLALGRPVISSIFRGPILDRYVAAVILPIMVGDRQAYRPAVGIPAKQFAKLIRYTASDRLVSILDRNGSVVARSEWNDEFTGKRISTSSDELNLRPSRGIVRKSNLEGVDFFWGYVRSDLTGWTVTAGMPESVLRANSRRLLAWFAGGGLIVLIAALVGAYRLGGRFSKLFGALGIDRTPTREEFQVLFEHASNGVMVLDANGHIALLNGQIERMFGFSREELIGNPVEILVPERARSGHSALRRGFGRRPEARPMGEGRDLHGQRKDGSEFPIEIGLNPIRTSAGNMTMATVLDISRRKLAAQKLSAALAERDELRRRFMQAQEAERLRLAHELHDQTGQSLTAVMLELKAFQRHVNLPSRERLRLIRLQLEQMGKALHHVAWELRPASIDELGLASALATYASEWSEQYGIETDFHCGDALLDQLPDDIRTTLYRVIQEGLTNVAKHASAATSVSIVIERIGETIRLMIEDDGCGFDPTIKPEPTAARCGLGLAGMRERLALVGGEVAIESGIGAGTTIFARIPLPRERTAA
jgi:PAS domain S-box-containing protein